MAVAGMVGALAAVFTLPEIEAFTRGFVLSALPATAARAAALASFTAGIALVAATASRRWATSCATTRCGGACWQTRRTTPSATRTVLDYGRGTDSLQLTGARRTARRSDPAVDRPEFRPCPPRPASQSAASLPPASSR